MLDKIAQFFEEIPDYRQQSKVNYPLEEILFCLIVGTICGGQGWQDIELICQNKLPLLKRYYPFKNGIAVHDTIARVVSAIEPKLFQECFINWMKAANYETQGQVIAIDGKTNRGSHDRRNGMKAIHMVSAFACGNGVVLGQVETDVKSNEITAIPELLALLDIKGSIITIDAMGCQKKIAQKIISKKADYILATKKNQGNLHEKTEYFFKICFETKFKDVAHDYHETIDKGHGRIETRRAWVSQDIDYLSDVTEGWPNLQSVIAVESERYAWDKKTKKMKTTLEMRYFISSLGADAVQALHSVRSHWAIENSLHWVLDMTYKEDDIRIRRGNAAANMSVVRHLSLNALKQEKTIKRGIKAKQLLTAMNEEYLATVLDILFTETQGSEIEAGA